MGKHVEFILRPIEKILEDATCAIGCISGMSRIPLNEYFLQSVFLRMTGEQEQKMKCICWELATEDYDYRYKRYNGKWELGECSNLNEKNKVYADLYGHTKDIDIDRQKIIDAVRKIIERFYNDAKLVTGNEYKYLDFENIYKYIKDTDIYDIDRSNDKINIKLLSTNQSKTLPNKYSLSTIYEFLYKHRNRCAHNTLSYQEPVMTLSKLQSEDNVYENYFLYFSLLIIIDKIFIETYKKYIEKLANILV